MEQSLDFANLPFPYCNIFATCGVQMFYQILMFLWVVVSNVVNWVGRKREDGWRVEMRRWLVVLLLLLLLLLTTMTMTRTVVRRCGVAAGLGEVVLSASWCWIESNWIEWERRETPIVVLCSREYSGKWRETKIRKIRRETQIRTAGKCAREEQYPTDIQTPT